MHNGRSIQGRISVNDQDRLQIVTGARQMFRIGIINKADIAAVHTKKLNVVKTTASTLGGIIAAYGAFVACALSQWEGQY